MALGGRDWLLATAAPAGPAFEGAAIRCGMRAAEGAIEAPRASTSPSATSGSFSSPRPRSPPDGGSSSRRPASRRRT
ncbi:MAG: ASKHA domain-containing protein [Trebonia sp.]